MQVVGDLVEESGGHLLTLVVDEVHLDRPLTLWESLHFRRLVAIAEQSCQPVHIAFSSVCVCVGVAESERRAMTVCRALILCALLSVLTPKKGSSKTATWDKECQARSSSKLMVRKEGRQGADHIHNVLLRNETNGALDLYQRMRVSTVLETTIKAHEFKSEAAKAQRVQSVVAARRQHFRTAQLDGAARGGNDQG